MLKDTTLGEARGFIRVLKTTIQGHQTSLREETTDVKDNLTKRSAGDIKESITDIELALEGSFWYKAKRVAALVSDFEIRLDAHSTQYIDLWVKEK